MPTEGQTDGKTDFQRPLAQTILGAYHGRRN